MNHYPVLPKESAQDNNKVDTNKTIVTINKKLDILSDENKSTQKAINVLQQSVNKLLQDRVDTKRRQRERVR